MAARLALPVHEKKLEPYDFLMADEAFLTASSYTILPVVEFEGRPVGDGKVGAVYQRLLQTWGEQVGVDIADQAKKIRAKYGE